MSLGIKRLKPKPKIRTPRKPFQPKPKPKRRNTKKVDISVEEKLDALKKSAAKPKAPPPPPPLPEIPPNKKIASDVAPVTDEAIILQALAQWQLFPEVWAREAMGWDGVGRRPEITHQQLELLCSVGAMVRAKMKYEEVLNGMMEESELTERDWYYIKKQGVSVMSGKGTGKGAALTMLITWFLRMFDRCKSPITGPSYDQVRKGLVAELHKWLNYKEPTTGEKISKVSDEFVVQRDLIFLKAEGNQSRFFSVRTAPPNANEEQQKGTLDGWHEEAVMVIVDEAASVANGVFTSFNTTLTSPLNLVVMVFNPTRSDGFAYETHFGPRAESWVQLHWDSRESPLVTPAQLEAMERDYGKDGAEYRINVLGLPAEDDPSSLISRSWVRAAADRWGETDGGEWSEHPIVAGFDPAREGRDESAYVVRQGKRVLRSVGCKLTKSNELGDWALQQMAADDVDVMYIDTIGIGGPMMDYMRCSMANPRALRAADVRRAATDKKYHRIRDEMWWRLRAFFEGDEIAIPEDRILMNELSAIHQGSPTNKGKTTVETKKQMRSRGMPSPNRADALMLTMFSNDKALTAAKRGRDDDDYGDPPNYGDGVSWMGR